MEHRTRTSWWRWTLHVCVATLAVAAGTTVAHSDQLQPGEVLVLYNSQSAVSTAIKDAYVLARPGVQMFDLNFSYTTPANPNNPGPTDVTPFVIHPVKFDALTNSSSPLGVYLSQHPEILCIATTREIPGLISLDFTLAAVTDSDQLARSTESVLAALPSFDPQDFPPAKISYFWSDLFPSFSEYLAANPGSPIRYLVSRLDSNNANAWDPSVQDDSYLDDIEALIARSSDLTVNNYGILGLVDDWDIFSSAALDGPFMSTIQSNLWELFWKHGWCLDYEGTCQFLHGPGDPFFNLQTDGPYTTDHETLWLFTMGRHHTNPTPLATPCPQCAIEPEEVCEANCEPGHMSGNYVRSYRPHPAGLFASQESYNGYNIHRPGLESSSGGVAGHGQVLDWIASGGSFAIGHVAEPTSLCKTCVGRLLDKLYNQEWPWAEAFWKEVRELNWNRTPIGDPLATVKVVRPDLNGDRVVDEDDLDIVTDAIAAGTVAGDVNGDGVTDQTDLELLLEVAGRTCGPPAIPCPVCRGDLNGDGIVDGADLAVVSTNFGAGTGLEGGDANCDGFVDGGDYATVLANWGVVRADVNRDGCVDDDDLDLEPPRESRRLV